MAPPVSAQKPWNGRSRVMREPIVCTMRQPPISVPSPIARVAREHDPERHVELAAEIALRVEQHGDDAHGLLRVVAAVAERIERRRDELQRAEDAVDRKGRVAHEHPRHDQEQQHRQDEAAERRQHDRRRWSWRGPPRRSTLMPALAVPAPTRPPISACELDDGIPKPPGDDVPDDRAHQRAEHHARIDDVGGDDAGADGLRDVRAEDQEGDEVEEGRPDHGGLRAQHARRDDRWRSSWRRRAGR